MSSRKNPQPHTGRSFSSEKEKRSASKDLIKKMQKLIKKGQKAREKANQPD